MKNPAAQPVEPPLQWLAELLFIIHAVCMLIVLVDFIKHEAAKQNHTAPATHEKR